MNININDGLQSSNFILLTNCLHGNVLIIHYHFETYCTNHMPIKATVSFAIFVAVI